MAGHLFGLVRAHAFLGALALLFSASFAGAAGAQGSADAAERVAQSQVSSGDVIVLRFLRERMLSDSVVVNVRGEAVFPKLGVMNVSRFTIAQLQDTLLARYAEYLRQPELQVMVLRRVVVNGEVRMPGVYHIDASSTVRDVLARAGGPTESANRKKVFIVRDGERISAQGWERDVTPAMDLRSGDQLMIGRKNWLVMNAFPVISTAISVTSFVIFLTNK
jgi:protein involved in polysaccharide export with SLBB domain